MEPHMATGKRKHVAEVMVIALSLLLSWFWQQAMARINIRVSHNARRKKAVKRAMVSCNHLPTGNQTIM